MQKSPISTKYEPLQYNLINKCSKLNAQVYKAIKNAKVDNANDLLFFLGAYISLHFNTIRKTTNAYMGVFDEDVKEISNQHDLSLNKSIASKMKNQTYIELNSNLVCAEKELMQKFRQAIKPFKNIPTHINDLKNTLQNEFIKNGGVCVTYKNGAKVRLDKYYAMVTRTARNETQNLTSLDDAKRLGTDYVYLKPNLGSCCKTCSTLGNRVYCISGNDKKYPSIYDVLFKNDYHCIHPHCKCILRPFFPEHHSNAENRQLLKDSNRALELDQRTEQQRQQYQNQQSFNHRIWSSQLEYEQAKQVLGKELPSQLETKSKFQTAKTKNTPRYQETQQTVKAIKKLGESKPINVAEIKTSIYTQIGYELKNPNVIITKKQFDRHIAPGANQHNDIFLQVQSDLPKIINNPDYIFKDVKHRNTVLVIRKVNNVQIAVKLSCISKKLSNTIITIIPMGKRRLNQMIRNSKILYKKE